jgi:hypothetical protein
VLQVVDRGTTVILNPKSRFVSKRACCFPVITDVGKVVADSNNFIYPAWRHEVRGTGLPDRWAPTDV